MRKTDSRREQSRRRAAPGCSTDVSLLEDATEPDVEPRSGVCSVGCSSRALPFPLSTRRGVGLSIEDGGDDVLSKLVVAEAEREMGAYVIAGGSAFGWAHATAF